MSNSQRLYPLNNFVLSSNEEDIVVFSSHRSRQVRYSETLNNEYIERIHQMSYSSLSDNGMLQIFSFLIK